MRDPDLGHTCRQISVQRERCDEGENLVNAAIVTSLRVGYIIVVCLTFPFQMLPALRLLEPCFFRGPQFLADAMMSGEAALEDARLQNHRGRAVGSCFDRRCVEDGKLLLNARLPVLLPMLLHFPNVRTLETDCGKIGKALAGSLGLGRAAVRGAAGSWKHWGEHFEMVVPKQQNVVRLCSPQTNPSDWLREQRTAAGLDPISGMSLSTQSSSHTGGAGSSSDAATGTTPVQSPAKTADQLPPPFQRTCTKHNSRRKTFFHNRLS